MKNRNPLEQTMLKHAWGYSRMVARAKNDIDRTVNHHMFEYWFRTYSDYKKGLRE